MRICFVISNFFLLISLQGYAQGTPDSSSNFNSAKYLDAVSAKTKKLDEQLDKKSARALAAFKKQEEKLLRKLSKFDSSKAKLIAETAKNRFEQLEAKLKNPGKLSQYIPGLDSMATTLNFLKGESGALSQVSAVKDKVKDALGKMDELKAELKKAEDIKAFLKERRQQLKESLEKLGFARELKKINKQAYYYTQQLKEYKDILNDPKKIEKKTLGLLSKTKLWKDFFRKNSMLASLFRIPDPDEPLNMASLAGLQTRAQVNGLIQQQIASGGPNAQQQLQQNLQAAQSQLNELKSKVIKAGGGSSDAEMPEGFKPNDQKTKSFLKRLEYGANIQTQKASLFFPVTSDLGLSLGYKLNNRSVIGVGASYKMGWGRGWNDINITHQGLGLRTYLDWKIKGSFWLSGGYEQHYRSAFSGIDQLRGKSGWQQSGLLGLSKIVSVKSKLFKKTKLMLLWDFMSYGQVPRGQALVFRLGYAIK